MICPCSTIDKKFIPPEGSRKPRVYIAGMVPGEEEVKEGRPFVGPSGKVLRSALSDAGIDIESEVRIFNAVADQLVGWLWLVLPAGDIGLLLGLLLQLELKLFRRNNLQDARLAQTHVRHELKSRHEILHAAGTLVLVR